MVRGASHPNDAHERPIRPHTEEGLATLVVIALRHVAAQGGMLIKQGHRLGTMQQVHIAHAVRRRISEHKLVQRPLLHDPFSDLTLRR